MKDQIAELLAKGYTAAQVSSMLGCSEAYISELFKEEGFQEILKPLIVKYATERIDQRYDKLEEATIKQIQKRVNDDLVEMSDLTRVLESIARIRSAKKLPNANTYQNPTIGITLNFPAGSAPKLVTDDKSRVIAIGDRTMMPMPAKAVKHMFETMENGENNGQTVEQLAQAG